MREQLRDIYLRVDPRSLGLFRIALGVALLVDLGFRAAVAVPFYSNAGLLPNHTLLWAPMASPQLSFFFTLSTPSEVRLGMAVCALVFAAFTLGYRTRVSHGLSLLCLMGLNHRLVPLENGGDVVMNVLCVFSLFVPLGARFSVDAVVASLAARREHHPQELADRVAMLAARPESTRPVTSIAVLALRLQLGVIYFFNVLHKSGPTWLDGTAVHYALHQDRLVSALGVFLRDHAPHGAITAASYGTLLLEAFGALAVLSPLGSLALRGLAVVLLPALHLAFAACLDLGIFSFAMITFFPLLLHRRHWALLGRLLSRGAHRVVYFDVDCGMCFALARLASRLDVLGRLTLLGNDGELPEGVTRARVEATLITRDPERGRIFERSAAVAQVIRVLPLGAPVAALMRLPGLSWLLDQLYDLVALRRARISAFLGFGVCGVARPVVPASDVGGPPSAARMAVERAATGLREGMLSVLFLACALAVLNGNRAVPPWLRIPSPAPLVKVVDSLRLYQTWSMFAPDAPTDDYALSVVAVTREGRVVDPYNQVASDVPGPLNTIPTLGQDQFFTAYSLLLPHPHFQFYRGAFEAWILDYPKRTGRPQDEIVRFVVYQLSDRTPPPGQTPVGPTTRREVMRYPHSPGG